MKVGGGKNKGNSFERFVCKRLSKWISNDERTDLFWRSAGSGSVATLAFKRGNPVNITQVGDVSLIDPLGGILTDYFVIECKSYKNLHLDSLIFGTPKTDSILEFWTVVKEAAKNINKEPMLIAKQNGKEPLILLRLTPYTITNRMICPNWISASGTNDFIMWDFETFLSLTDPYQLRYYHE